MEEKILSTKILVEKIYEEVIQKVNELKNKNLIPKLAVILVGSDPASISHTAQKQKACERCGILSTEYNLSNDISENELLNLIHKLNNDKETTGILVQLPLPAHINSLKIIVSILPEKDVDGFHYFNTGKMFFKLSSLKPCTAYGIMKLLKFYNIRLEGKVVTVVGNSNIVGKPLTLMLINENATIINCNKYTKELKKFTELAEILISATGKPHLITEDMVQNNAIVIDVGYCRINNCNAVDEKNYKIVGDVDFDNVIKKVKFITPVPGGIGPLTVAALMKNVVHSCKLQYRI